MINYQLTVSGQVQGVGFENRRQEELDGDNLKTKVHDGGDGPGEDPGGNQDPDGEKDNQRIDPGPESAPHSLHDGVPLEAAQLTVNGEQDEGDEQRRLGFLLLKDNQVTKDT